MAKCGLAFWRLRVGIALTVAIFSGCDHQGEVEKLINNKYPEMQDGGRMKFTEYKESHTTDWAVRIFHAHGKVTWKEPWFLITSNTFAAADGLPEIKIAELYKPVNSGVVFSAVFYRGRTDSKPQVTLQLPSGEYFTASGLAKKYPNCCVALPGGRTVGAKIDTSLCKKKRDEAISKGDEYTKRVEQAVKDNTPESEKLSEVKYKNLNKKGLEDHGTKCRDLKQTIDKAFEGSEDIKRKLSYFKNFPLEKMGQDDAAKCLSEVKDAEFKLSNMVKSVDKLIREVESEQLLRQLKGITDIGIPQSTQTGEPPNQENGKVTIPVPQRPAGALPPDPPKSVRNLPKGSDAGKPFNMGGINIKVRGDD
ncbi:MAG: hypothetical protein IJU44_05930 [Kiritimatiellae bacterium]|nr:hypothetical protein [Kiritimatiellia bacterium]